MNIFSLPLFLFSLPVLYAEESLPSSVPSPWFLFLLHNQWIVGVASTFLFIGGIKYCASHLWNGLMGKLSAPFLWFRKSEPSNTELKGLLQDLLQRMDQFEEKQNELVRAILDQHRDLVTGQLHMANLTNCWGHVLQSSIAESMSHVDQNSLQTHYLLSQSLHKQHLLAQMFSEWTKSPLPFDSHVQVLQISNLQSYRTIQASLQTLREPEIMIPMNPNIPQLLHVMQDLHHHVLQQMQAVTPLTEMLSQLPPVS